MERIENHRLIHNYYEKYRIKDYFATDFKEDMFLVKYSKGETIKHAGDSVDNLYFMVKGSVKVNSIQENGKSKLVCMVKDFDMLGDIELFAGMDYVNDVMAVTETYCLGINLKKYREILLNDVVFTQYMAKSLARIVLENNVVESFNMLNSLETRVVTYILQTAEEDCFNEPLTSLAERMATSYRHLHRVISGLCDKQVLAKEGRTYRIIDKERFTKE
jgi:CRP-like cAMP-binding protein